VLILPFSMLFFFFFFETSPCVSFLVFTFALAIEILTPSPALFLRSFLFQSSTGSFFFDLFHPRFSGDFQFVLLSIPFSSFCFHLTIAHSVSIGLE